MLAAALLCLTLIAYFPALRGGLLWDDDFHVTKPELRSLHGLWRIWSDLGATHQYYPLLHTAFWIEHGLWGDAVLGYHLTNVGLHVLAALLVVAIARKLGLETAAWPAGFLFALHPVCVEAVAWISEQKSTLSAVFYLGSALIYLDFDRTRKRSQYALALLLFVMALLTKSVTATLPAALLLVFWWQRGRLDAKRDALPLLPWFGIGAAAGLFTAWVERTLIGAQGPEFALSFADRTLLAGRVVWFYLSKLAFPTNLMFFYPRWNIDAGQWWQYLFTLALLVLIAVLIWLSKPWLTKPGLAKTRRWPLAALLFFVGTLFPVLGFLNVYPFVYSYVADHFTYLASLGVIIPVAVAAARRPYLNALLVTLLVVLTWRQARMYNDAVTLYTENLRRNPASWISHNNLGVLYDEAGNRDAAANFFRRAIMLEPTSLQAHRNLANLAMRSGQLTEAAEEFKQVLRYAPDNFEAELNLGSLFLVQGDSSSAIALLNHLVQQHPDSYEAQMDLGLAFYSTKNSAARAHLETALRLKPESPEAAYNLGVLYEDSGQIDAAGELYRQALRYRPEYTKATQRLRSLESHRPHP